MMYDVIKPNSCPGITTESFFKLTKEAEQQLVSWFGIERLRTLNSIDARILFELQGESSFPKWVTVGLTPHLLRELAISAGRNSNIDIPVDPQGPCFAVGSDRQDLKFTLRVLPMLSPGPKVCLIVNNTGPSKQSLTSESSIAIDLLDIVHAATSPSIGPQVWEGPQLHGLRQEPALAGLADARVRLHPVPPEPRELVHQVQGLVQAESLAWLGARPGAIENELEVTRQSLQVHGPVNRFHAYMQVAPEQLDTCLPVRQATKDSKVATFQNCIVVPILQEGFRTKTDTVHPFMDFVSEVVATRHPALDAFIVGPARAWTLKQVSNSQWVRAEAKGEGCDPDPEVPHSGRRRVCRL
ncbi:MAG: hypothetical protein O9327_10535 [Polaromonas sp.]|nr:hypothetical protein [Polaromonas sp.]